MNSGRYVLSQILSFVHWQTLSRLVERYDAECCVRHFGCRHQLIAMVFAQLTLREGLRDIADCLNARPTIRYHLGFREPLAKSTLADANEQRDWRLWEDLAKSRVPFMPALWRTESRSSAMLFTGLSKVGRTESCA
jgi:hypothetical protein